MKLLKQPNSWTCCATSYAMLMNRQLYEVFNIAGHEGDEIYFDDLSDPARRRGHSVFEFIQHAKYCGFALTFFPIKMILQHQTDQLGKDSYWEGSTAPYQAVTHEWSRPLWQNQRGLALFRRIRKDYDLLIMGATKQDCYHHAAWCSERQVVYDPVGRITNEPEFDPYCFWAKIPL